jgi:hypothetical protein
MAFRTFSAFVKLHFFMAAQALTVISREKPCFIEVLPVVGNHMTISAEWCLQFSSSMALVVTSFAERLDVPVEVCGQSAIV